MISQEIADNIRNQIETQLDIISTKYNIKKRDRNRFLKAIKLKQPFRRKTIISYEERCKARKQDGTQCSRRHKPNEHFCGKHIHSQKYGVFKFSPLKTDNEKDTKHCIKKRLLTKEKVITDSLENNTSNRNALNNTNDNQSENNKITLRSILIKNKPYYIDKYDILYNPDPINGLYEIIGKLMDNTNNEIYYATSL